MVLKQKRQLAFGGATDRFDYDHAGLHPSFERRGYTYRYPNITPGCYYREAERKAKGIGYALSQQSEELSRNLAYRADFKLKEKSHQASVLGPGWHDPKPAGETKLGKFSAANRFPTARKWSTPGPGTYGKDHIPHLRIEEKRFMSFSDTPTFEFDNCMPRSIVMERAYHLPPNLYNMKSFAEEIVSKIVSKRGPYDLFSGARDDTSLYGHYAKSRVTSEGSALIVPCVSERLNNACNRYKGKFLVCGRETHPAIRATLTDPASSKPDPEKPGPSHYNPREPSRPPRGKFPFDSSVLHARPPKKNEFKPPPGRYELFARRRIFGNGWRSAFHSKTKRGLPLPEKMSWY